MNWFTSFINSSIGKKFVMATTGLLLCFFLVVHLGGNLMLFGGADVFNDYVKKLSALKPLVRIAEVLLVIIFGAHIFNGLNLAIKNKKAAGVPYTQNSKNENSSPSSRTMVITGSLFLAFLIFHLSTIWYNFQIELSSDQFFNIITGNRVGLGNLGVALLYAIGIVLLGFHLKHGFQSAFQTFGIRYNRYGKFIQVISLIFWLIVPAGFLTIVIYFGFMGGGN